MPDDASSKEAVISVRFGADDLERVRDAASRHGLTVSAYMRRAALVAPETRAILETAPSTAGGMMSANATFNHGLDEPLIAIHDKVTSATGTFVFNPTLV